MCIRDRPWRARSARPAAGRSRSPPGSGCTASFPSFRGLRTLAHTAERVQGYERCGTARHGTARHDTVRCGAVRCGAVRCGAV
eukprot:1951253-Prymnesium_polylepis.1